MSVATTAPALSALLDHFIDYAGLFPPAGLPLSQTVANFESYAGGEYAWMLRWLVLPAKDIINVPTSLDGRLAILGDTANERAASLETKSIVISQCPVYCEVSNLTELEAVKKAGCFAKIRTGGLKPQAIPALSQISEFILTCARLRLPFKATAGLHHPIRAAYPLTYDLDAPRAVMHGFLNVLMAAAFAWHGEKNVAAILAETDASAFSFTQNACWRDQMLTVEQIKDARSHFVHAVGSCSFDEPVQDLKILGFFN